MQQSAVISAPDIVTANTQYVPVTIQTGPVDPATATVKTRIAAPDVFMLPGYANGLLFAVYANQAPYTGYSTRAYQPIPDLTGYSAKVYQLSEAVGRGYPGTLTL